MKFTRKRKFVILTVGLIVIIIGAFTVFNFSNSFPRQGRPVSVKSNFNFDNQTAINFYQSLNTSSGLLREYPTSTTIYLSDDQQLDYAALLKLGDASLANGIDSTMEVALGGLYGDFNSSQCSYGNWNGVDVVLGAYMKIPCDTNFLWNNHSGFAVSASYIKIPNVAGYTVKETLWGGQMGSDYVHYADLDLYYCLNQLHYGHYADAVKAFENVNKMWNGYGFADAPYQNFSPQEYTSYKLALDLIAFKALMNNSHTGGTVVSYNSNTNQVQSMMSKLQFSDGGVISNYQVMNGQIQIPRNTHENGETTSLFVLAE